MIQSTSRALGLALSIVATASAAPPPESGVKLPLDVRLAAPSSVREDRAAAFTLEFVARNTGSSTVDTRLGRSVLRVNGQPLADWDITIHNGPRDVRWTALPAVVTPR
jgi:hypothetical protein